MSELTSYIIKELINLDYNCEYDGVNEPSDVQLDVMLALIYTEKSERLIERLNIKYKDFDNEKGE